MSTLRPRTGRSFRKAGGPANRKLAWTGIITILALILTMFPQVVPGGSLPSASAHNLNQSMVYMFFDPDTQKVLDLRAASIVPPKELLQVGDELGIIIKVIPDEGTSTGVGGYVDFYVPNGTQVIDVGYILPGDNAADGITTGWDKVPMKGQALMPDVGAGGESKFDLFGHHAEQCIRSDEHRREFGGTEPRHLARRVRGHGHLLLHDPRDRLGLLQRR